MLPVQASAEHHQQSAGHRHLHQAAQPGPALCHVQQGQCARDCSRAPELPAGKPPPSSNKNIVPLFRPGGGLSAASLLDGVLPAVKISCAFMWLDM